MNRFRLEVFYLPVNTIDIPRYDKKISRALRKQFSEASSLPSSFERQLVFYYDTRRRAEHAAEVAARAIGDEAILKHDTVITEEEAWRMRNLRG